ncbi:MAG: glycosyl transferase group 1 [Sphingobacteriales bacterium]|nr:glycosyl transferase group 1 [Sphingobacteriales bacterium]
MKILFLSHRFNPFVGGIEVISELLATGFSKAGHIVHLLTWTAEVSDTQYPFKVIRNPGVLKLVKEHAWADLVFENNLCLRLAWPGLFFGRPSVIALHTWISRVNGKKNWRDKLKENWWLQRAKKVIAVSEVLKNSCGHPAIIIGNPYRASEFNVDPAIPKTAQFVFLGRLVTDKGVDLAIRAIKELVLTNKNQVNKPQLTIIGDGPERIKLTQLVSDLELINFVHFAGLLKGKELVKQLNQHRYMLVPSVWEEPFGVVALEGMACGCIPIVANTGGLPEAVGIAGLTFQGNSVNSLVAGINWLMNNAEVEQQLRNNAPSHLKDHHPETVIKKYLNILEDTFAQ